MIRNRVERALLDQPSRHSMQTPPVLRRLRANADSIQPDQRRGLASRVRRPTVAVFLAVASLTALWLVAESFKRRPIETTVDPQTGWFYVTTRGGVGYKNVCWPAEVKGYPEAKGFARRRGLTELHLNGRPLMMPDTDVKRISLLARQKHSAEGQRVDLVYRHNSSFFVEAKIRLVDGYRSWDGQGLVGAPYYRVEVLELLDAYEYEPAQHPLLRLKRWIESWF